MQHRSNAGPYYGKCVQEKCNRLEARETPSGHGLIQERKSTFYGKPIVQFNVRMTLACVRAPPRENRIRVNLGLLWPINRDF